MTSKIINLLAWLITIILILFISLIYTNIPFTIFVIVILATIWYNKEQKKGKKK